MATFLNNLLLGRQYIGAELFTENNQEKIAVLKTKRKRNEIVITDKKIFGSSDDAGIEKTKHPAVLVINNAHVLQKEVEGIETNEKKILHKAYPNIKTEDFYYEIWSNGTNTVVSLCRKIYVDSLLNELNSKLRIYKVSLGTSAIAQITGFVTQTVIFTNTQEINFNSTGIISNNNQHIKEDYDINGLLVPSTYILGFSAVLKLLTEDKSKGNIHELNAGTAYNYNQKTFFEKALAAGIFFILFILLINFFTFSFFYDKSNQMTQVASIDKTTTETIIKTKKDIQDKEARLKNFTSSGISKSSLLINNIVKNIPHSILLTEINYHPLEKKVKEGENIMSDDNTILISGNVLSNNDFTNWIESLQKLRDISTVTITSFGKDTNSKSVFTIEITTRNEIR